MCRRNVMSFAWGPVIFLCNSCFWCLIMNEKSRELPSTAWNLSIRKEQLLQLIQVPELLLHQGWLAQCPGYIQQLFQPGKQPTWSISDCRGVMLPRSWCKHLNCAVCFLILLCRPERMNKVLRPALPWNIFRRQTYCWRPQTCSIASGGLLRDRYADIGITVIMPHPL